MKVYIIERQNYEMFDILGVFTDEKLALSEFEKVKESGDFFGEPFEYESLGGKEIRTIFAEAVLSVYSANEWIKNNTRNYGEEIERFVFPSTANH